MSGSKITSPLRTLRSGHLAARIQRLSLGRDPVQGERGLFQSLRWGALKAVAGHSSQRAQGSLTRPESTPRPGPWDWKSPILRTESQRGNDVTVIQARKKAPSPQSRNKVRVTEADRSGCGGGSDPSL